MVIILILVLILFIFILRENFIPIYVSYRSRDTIKFNDYYSGAAGLAKY